MLPRRSGRPHVERKLYTPSPFNAGCSYTESNMRSPTQLQTTPAKQVGGGYGTPAQCDYVSLSGRRVQDTPPAQSPMNTMFFSRVEEESPSFQHQGTTAMQQLSATAEQIFNAWCFTEPAIQSESFMLIDEASVTSGDVPVGGTGASTRTRPTSSD